MHYSRRFVYCVLLKARMVHAGKCSESGLIISCMVSTLHCILFFVAPNPLIALCAFVPCQRPLSPGAEPCM